ncbi:MAG: glycerol-3-phosphate 1-O-acyltransferase PlsY [Gallionellaceae bacterium]|nr:glycerol-3-phosphate 1-O-acyltransferase PlsY [Gallionellaceae bacterium]MDD5364022.1 glycerol-3-phosphate 1-O-acyltransferase PlsY [Gallionellaceae bacterium]
MIESILTVLIAYLIGSLSFAVILSKVFGMPDPRGYGSGNPGATNVLRSGRKAVAGLTLLGDALKGVAAVLLAKWATAAYGLPDYLPALAGLAVLLGHIWPVFFGFQGGKGVATALGLLLALNLWLGLACAATWLLAFALTRVSSLSALLAAGVAPVYAWLIEGNPVGTFAMAGLAVLIFWRHKTNIARLLSGEEAAFKPRKGTSG